MTGGAAFHWLLYSLGMCADRPIPKHLITNEKMIANYTKTSQSLLEIGVFEGVTTRLCRIDATTADFRSRSILQR